MSGRDPKEIRSSKIWRLRPQVSISCHSVICSKVLRLGGMGGWERKLMGLEKRKEQREEAGSYPQVKDSLVPHKWGLSPT